MSPRTPNSAWALNWVGFWPVGYKPTILAQLMLSNAPFLNESSTNSEILCPNFFLSTSSYFPFTKTQVSVNKDSRRYATEESYELWPNTDGVIH